MSFMKVEKTVTISVSGVLTVTISAPDRAYKGIAIYAYATWSPIDYPPFYYTIEWGDGTKSEGSVDYGNSTPTLMKTYASTGTFTIKATVTDSMGQTGSATKSITIAEQLTASLTADKTSGTVPLAVTFTCGASGGFLDYTWTLDFGDGTTPSSGTRTAAGNWTVSHTYNKVGTFTAKLTVTDALGASAVPVAIVSIELPGLVAIIGPMCILPIAFLLASR
jgi:PKD repeat protein